MNCREWAHLHSQAGPSATIAPYPIAQQHGELTCCQMLHKKAISVLGNVKSRIYKWGNADTIEFVVSPKNNCVGIALNACGAYNEHDLGRTNFIERLNNLKGVILNGEMKNTEGHIKSLETMRCKHRSIKMIFKAESSG